MSVLVLAEHDNSALRPATLNTVTAAAQLGDDIHLRVHSHETAGISIAQYRAALDAGADGIDLSMAPMSGGTAPAKVAA